MTVNEARGAATVQVRLPAATGPGPVAGERPITTGPPVSTFEDELANVARPVHISRHAQNRLERRNIDLRPDDLARLRGAVEALARKGAHQSVVMLDQLALVVNVPSATVVTAVQPRSGKESVFTSIDSVVIA